MLFLQGVVAASMAVAAAQGDSAATLRHLRAQQRSLEWRRRNTLPEDRGGAAAGPCDARIGKYCYWAGDRPEKRQPDAPEFMRWRAEFIAQLDGAAAAHPGDLWIAAARVRYRAESGDTAGAVTAARECEGSAWCGALLGYALHAAGRHREAEAAFDAARARLPDGVACRWDDLRPLLEGESGARFSDASCAGRDSLARRVWWLATPLFLAGANDLRAEYFARRTRAWIERDEASAQFLWWDDDIPELWARYGWPTWLTRASPPVGSYQDASIIGHDPTPSFAWLPSESALRAPFTAGESAWADVVDHRARMRYAPPWLHTLDALPHQFARFRRGDSLLVIAAYDASRDTSFHAARARAGLFAGPGDARMHRVTDPHALLRGALALVVPADSAVVSLELWSPDDSAAARARRGIGPLAGAISDLLLFDATEAPAARGAPSLAEVTPLARTTDTIARSRSLGVYWEAYRAPDDTAAAEIAVTLEPMAAGWLRRTLWKAGLGARATAVRLRWAAPPRPTDPAQSVALSLRELPPGAYRLVVTIRDSRRSSSTARTVTLR